MQQEIKKKKWKEIFKNKMLNSKNYTRTGTV